MNGGLRHLDSQKCKLGPGLVFCPILNSFALGERWKKDNERANLGLHGDFQIQNNTMSTKHKKNMKHKSRMQKGQVGGL